MERDFRNGFLEIDFPTQPFDSPVTLLARAVVVFLTNVPFLVALTLLIFLPGKLAVQFVIATFAIPKLPGGLLDAGVDMLLVDDGVQQTAGQLRDRKGCDDELD